MAKVLFVVRELKMEPLGIMYLAAALKRAGHKVLLAREDYGDSPSLVLRKFLPDFVCYSVCSGSEGHYFAVDARLRSRNPDIRFKSLYGGPAVTFNPDEFAGRWHIRGEGEKAIVDFVEGRQHKDLVLMDINEVPSPDRELVYSVSPDIAKNPMKNMITRRGCVGGCSYCMNRVWNKLHSGQFPKGIVRVRDVRNVIAEAVDLKTKWQPLKMINFVDDDFAKPIEWLREFAPLYRARVGVPFFASSRPEDLTEEAVKLLKEAGCEVVNMAIESANDDNRRSILLRRGTKQAVRDAIALCKKYDIRTRLQNIIGLPIKDALGDAYETLDFNIAVNPTSSWCALLQAYKGTDIYEIALEGGYADEKGTVDEGFFNTSTLKIAHRRLIERLHKLWPLIIRYPIVRWLTPLLIRIPLPFSWYCWFFAKTKRWLAERDLWRVFK
jgi:radical SAM superfamily enzyme YgiQ (UPF0313 family)